MWAGSRRGAFCAGVPTAIVVVVLLGGIPLAGGWSAPGAAGSAGHVLATAHPSKALATLSVTPGRSGTGPWVDGPALYRANHETPYRPSANGSNASSGPTTAPSPAPSKGPPIVSPVPATRTSASGIGWISGHVHDSWKGTPVVGADVELLQTGPTCNATGGPIYTNASGYFFISGCGGSAVLQVNATNYLLNRSFPVVVAGVVTSVGTMLLVHYATADGTVVGNLPGAPPIVNVSVSSATRDGALSGPDSNVTARNGSFSIAVDPIPIEVDFQPPAPTAYYPNGTFLDPNPWQVIHLGKVYLDGGVVVKAHVVDAVTGAGIAAGATFVSDRIDGGSLTNTSSVSNVTYFSAAAGPGFADFSASGYVQNVTQIPDIPSGTAGPVDIGTVRLVPYGAVSFTVRFTGGTPSNSSWPADLPGQPLGFYALVCDLTTATGGEQRFTEVLGGGAPCDEMHINVGVTYQLAAPPLRDILYIVRDPSPFAYPYPTSFPVRQMFISFPGGGIDDLNQTWLNVTPDAVTNVGTLGVSAGTYLSGSVVVSAALQQVLPGVGARVQVCSVVRTGSCLDAVTASAVGPSSASVPQGCPTTAWTFCAPAPPGPDRVVITLGAAYNGTWITVPTRCCAQQGNPTAIGKFALTYQVANLTGSVGVEGAPIGTLPPGGGAGVTVCSTSFLNQQCYQGQSIRGNFTVPAPFGWDVVTVNDQGYRSNYTWVDVTGNNSTGVIEIGPLALVGGQVVAAATGAPVPEATVEACLVVNPAECHYVGVTVGTNGTYNGTLPALPYPAGSYGFRASASGFDDEIVYANLTAGALTTVPTIRLPAIGVGLAPHGAGARAAASSSPTTGSWVTGKVVDARSGLAVGGATISECFLSGPSACGSLGTIIALDDGRFNLSTVHGAYELWVNASEYQTGRAYLNATQNGTVALGDISLVPLDRLTGRVLLDPWASLATNDGLGADQMIITGCTQNGGSCGPAAATNSGGFFNFSLPAGPFDTVTFGGTGLLVPSCGNGLAGMATLQVAITVSSSITVLPGSGPNGSLEASVLTWVAGTLNETSSGTATPAWFTSVGAVPTNGSGGPTTSGLSDGSGGYAAFVPPGIWGYSVRANAAGLVPGSSGAESNVSVAGAVFAGPNLTLTKYGYADGTVRDASSHVPIDEAVFTVNVSSTFGPLSGNAFSNGTGAVNISAPPGYGSYTASAAGYSNVTGYSFVTSGDVSNLGTVNLTGLPDGGVAIVRTVQINTLGAPPSPGLYDNVTDHPVYGSVIDETAPGIQVGTQGSDLGEFLLSGIPANSTNITIHADGFSTVTYSEYFPAGRTDRLSANLSADGLIEGRVVSLPGNRSVPYAVLDVCPYGVTFCENFVESNATGWFWAAAPAGLDQVMVESATYLTNLTQIVSVASDSFNIVGNIPVFGFATLHGVVRGLPSADLLAGANVSVCSIFSPSNGCYADESVSADANGTFTITSPPGNYVLYVTYPGYNATRYTIVLNPGANVSLGIVFLQEDGIAAGTVVGPTGAPIASALVYECAAWGGGDCSVPVATDSLGRYALSGPPGPAEITASATGYLDGSARVTFVSGHTTNVPAIALALQPPNILEWVNGSVHALANGRALAGLLAVATESGARVAQDITASDGTFALHVHWGTAVVFVGGGGYLPENATLQVHANVAGLSFSLAEETYLVHGLALDAGTHGGLGGVAVSENGSVLGTSNGNGLFSFLLPNGTARLVASFAGTGPVKYGVVPFIVNVQGGSTEHNVTLPRTAVPLSGVVVDAVLGSGVRGASVELWSGSGDQVAAATTDGSGGFSFEVAPGIYNVSVDATGYDPANVTVATGALGNHTAIGLLRPPASATSSHPLTFTPTELAVVAGVAVVALAAAVVLVRRRRPPVEPGQPVDAEYRIVGESPEFK